VFLTLVDGSYCVDDLFEFLQVESICVDSFSRVNLATTFVNYLVALYLQSVSCCSRNDSRDSTTVFEPFIGRVSDRFHLLIKNVAFDNSYF